MIFLYLLLFFFEVLHNFVQLCSQKPPPGGVDMLKKDSNKFNRRVHKALLLFLLYVNDLHRWSSVLDSHLFADDPTFFYKIKTYL